MLISAWFWLICCMISSSKGLSGDRRARDHVYTGESHLFCHFSPRWCTAVPAVLMYKFCLLYRVDTADTAVIQLMYLLYHSRHMVTSCVSWYINYWCTAVPDVLLYWCITRAQIDTIDVSAPVHKKMRPYQRLSGCCVHTQAMGSTIQGGYGITSPGSGLYSLAKGA